MSYLEDLTRIRVNEVIQDGLRSQETGRHLGSRRPSPRKVIAVVMGLIVVLSISLTMLGVF